MKTENTSPKKNLIAMALVTLVINIFMYCLFAFVLWEMRPSLWDEGARFLLAMLIALVAFVMIMIFLLNHYEKK